MSLNYEPSSFQDECLAHPWLSMDTQRDVVELVDAFVKLKMLHRSQFKNT